MVIISDRGGSVGWLGGGGDGLYCDRDLELVGQGGGERLLVSKILFSAVSPLIHSLVREQGFCSGCTQTTTIVLPWTDNMKLRELVDMLNCMEEEDKDRKASNKSVKIDDIVNRVDHKEFSELMEGLMIEPQYQEALWFALAQKTKTAKLSNTGRRPSVSKRKESWSLESTSSPTNLETQGTKRKIRPDIDDEINRTMIGPSVKIQRLNFSKIDRTAVTVTVTKQTHQELPSNVSKNTNAGLPSNGAATGPLIGVQTKINGSLDNGYMSLGKEVTKESKLLKYVESSVKVPSPMYKCYLCPNGYKTRQSLYNHYACQHFRKEMKEFSNCGSCPICSIPLVQGNAVLHIATAHSYVEKFMPPQHHVKKIKKGGRVLNKEKERPEAPVNVEPPKLTIHPATKPLPKRTLRCSQLPCKQMFPSRTLLYNHYAVAHFKEEMEKFFDCKICPMCNIPLENRQRTINHIAAFHSYVEKFLPPQDHVKKFQFQKGKVSKAKAHPTKKIACRNVVLKKKMHKCYLCKLTMPSRTVLYSHYAYMHFKEEMDKISDCKLCPICNKPQASYNAAIGHLASVHSYVEKFLPAQHHVKKIEPGRFHRSKIMTMESRKMLKFKCSLCPLKSLNRTTLYTHYGGVHFKDEMEKFSDCSICPMCSKPLTTFSALGHIAATHSYVEKFLPPKHHVEKKKGRKGLGVYGKKIKSKKYIASESSSDESKVDVTHADVYTETVLEDHDHPFVAIKEEVLAEYSDEAENLDGLVVNDIKLEKPDSDPEEDEEYPLEYSAIDIVDNLSPLRQSQLENQIEDSTTPQE